MFIDNELKAYFLGWMYSDGTVGYSNIAQSYHCKLKIKEEDNKILHLFKNLSTFTLGNEIKDNKNYPYILSYNRKFCIELIQNGVIPDKSYSNKAYLFFPLIDLKYYPYFIRGLFDGDGSYGIYNGHFNVSLYMSNFEFLKQLQNILQSNNIISIISKTKENVYTLRIRNEENCKKFIKYIFEDNLHLSLERKLKIIKEAEFNYKRLPNKSPKCKNIHIRVETPDGKLLGIYKNTTEIERLSKNDNFILNIYSTKGKISFLRNTNISASCRTGKPYKGLYYEYIDALAPNSVNLGKS